LKSDNNRTSESGSHAPALGLYGGSFDPVHLGHLLVAQAAREELELDRLIFIPAAQSPFKPSTPTLDASQRVRLLHLALAGETNMDIDTLEIDRGGISFTIDTLRHYAQKYPGSQLYYLIGADHAAFLPQWRQANELAQLAQFIVIPRPGGGSATLPPPFKGRTLTGFPFGVSSSQIRTRIREGKPITRLVPATVAEAIQNNHLYL